MALVVVVVSMSATTTVPVYVTEQVVFMREREEGRALHSSTSQINLSRS
jgi:hypothetical protein